MGVIPCRWRISFWKKLKCKEYEKDYRVKRGNIKMNQLEIQFQGSSPSGPFTIRRPFSVMTAYYVPRENIKSAKSMKGIGRYGIYFLYGNGRIYIGQTRNGIGRIMEHTRGKQFWDEAVLFLADSIHFNLNIISGLERHAIESAMDDSPYAVENKSVPQYETASDFEMEQIISIYEEISFISDFLGIRTKAGKDTAAKVKPEDDRKTATTEKPLLVTVPSVDKAALGKIFHTTKRGIKGLLAVTADGYVVLSNSVIDVKTPLYDNDRVGIKRRQEALQRGIIVAKQDDDTYILTANCIFQSPSAAAKFVLGGSQNGLKEWVDDENTPLAKWLSEHQQTEERKSE